MNLSVIGIAAGVGLCVDGYTAMNARKDANLIEKRREMLEVAVGVTLIAWGVIGYMTQQIENLVPQSPIMGVVCETTSRYDRTYTDLMLAKSSYIQPEIPIPSLDYPGHVFMKFSETKHNKLPIAQWGTEDWENLFLTIKESCNHAGHSARAEWAKISDSVAEMASGERLFCWNIPTEEGVVFCDQYPTQDSFEFFQNKLA